MRAARRGRRSSTRGRLVRAAHDRATGAGARAAGGSEHLAGIGGRRAAVEYDLAAGRVPLVGHAVAVVVDAVAGDLGRLVPGDRAEVAARDTVRAGRDDGTARVGHGRRADRRAQEARERCRVGFGSRVVRVELVGDTVTVAIGGVALERVELAVTIDVGRIRQVDADLGTVGDPVTIGIRDEWVRAERGFDPVHEPVLILVALGIEAHLGDADAIGALAVAVAGRADRTLAVIRATTQRGPQEECRRSGLSCWRLSGALAAPKAPKGQEHCRVVSKGSTQMMGPTQPRPGTWAIGAARLSTSPHGEARRCAMCPIRSGLIRRVHSQYTTPCAASCSRRC